MAGIKASLVLIVTCCLGLWSVYGIDVVNNFVCGNTNGHTNPEANLQGNATRCQFSWIVQVLTTTTNRTCTGVIIDNRLVLTALHCLMYTRGGVLVQPSEREVFVRTGDFLPPNPADRMCGINDACLIVRRNVSRIRRLGTLSQETLVGDIAMLVLSENIPFDICHRPICMINSSMSHTTAENCLDVGWGINTIGQDVLQWAQIQVGQTEICNQKFGNKSNADTYCTTRRYPVCSSEVLH